jgi:glycosyltransferase involved in cell wall biosynthesis
MELALLRASAVGRRLLLPDENVTWNATAIPKAIAIARQEGIDAVLTTSPPGSVHLIGAAVKRATGAKWVADLRDSIALHPHRSSEGMGARAKQKARAGIAHLVARQADAIVTAAEAITEETKGLSPRGRVVTIPNGCDFDDFAGLAYTRGDRFRLTHAGSFFGKRDPKPFLRALAASGLDDVTVRFLGDFRPGDREFMESLGLAGRVELIEHVPRRESLRLQRDSDALLLLIPEAGGRGRGILSGKVFEYLAAERPVLAVVPPDGAAAQLVRDTGAGVVAAPEDVDGIRDALVELHARWRAGRLDGTPLSQEWRDKLSRAARVEELAELLQGLV